MLTYMDIHLKYTLPAIGALALIARPFVCRSEIFKIAAISALAFMYTITWGNHIINNGALTYSNERILSVVGRMPIEDYVSIVLQTVLTTLWTLLCVRWSLHACVNFNYNKQSYQTIRWVPILFLSVLTMMGYGMAVPGQNTFYLGSILYWACPVIMLLWYGTGNYFVKKIISSSIAIAIPTLYLCKVNQMALKNNVRHINEQTSLNKFAADGLPLEEALLVFVSNFIIVLAANSFDKARGMMEVYTYEFPERFNLTWKYMRQLLVTFATAECSMPSIVTEDIIKGSFELMHSVSKILCGSSFVYQSGIRLDLIIVYAFGRITDNIIDDNTSTEKKTKKLKAMDQFLDDLFGDRKSDFEVKKEPCEVKIDWAKYETELTELELACFRAFSRVAFYLPRKPFYELFEGYHLDVEDKEIRTEEELILYCNLVAGSFGPLCVYIIMYRCDDDSYDILNDYGYIVKKSYQLGRSLQYVNMSRDVVSDSESLGRVYIPTEYMDDKEELRIMNKERNARSLGDKKLRKYISRMIKFSDKEYVESVDLMKCLPYETRGATLAAVDIYRQGHINAIERTSPTAPNKPSVSTMDKISIAIHSLYVKSIPYVF